RKKIIKELANVKDRDSIVGKITFDDHGRYTVPAIAKYVVQDGKWLSWEESEDASGKRKLTGGKWRMSLWVIAQYVMNGAMLGMMWALVAVGFTPLFSLLGIL